MTDKISKEMRSKNMRSIRHKNTKPELVARKLLTALGYRYRIHKGDLPGKPDIVFPGRRKVIFVHGCFWHSHPVCSRATVPNIEYWKKKLQSNQERDKRHIEQLHSLGWKTLIVWECELKSLCDTQAKLISFLGPTKK